MADGKLGAWKDDQEIISNAPLSGSGQDAEAPAAVRFGRSIERTVARRERSTEARYDRPAAFLLMSRSDFERLPQRSVRMPSLHTGHFELTGQIHFVNVAGNGWSLEYSGNAPELFDTIGSFGFGNLPTLIYHPKQYDSVLSWFPSGIMDDGNVKVRALNEAAPSINAISEVIDAVHRSELVTPDQTSRIIRLWEDAKLGHAHSEAEARIQKVVQIALQGAFRRISIRPEQPGKDGRTDLEVVDDVDRTVGQIVNLAVLELKALREFGSNGARYTDKMILEHMVEGLNQSYVYRTDRKFKESMLCCFDMREKNLGDKTVFAQLASDAEKLNVHLRRWFLYRSSQHYRDCKVREALSGEDD